jgi:hypothetical protein
MILQCYTENKNNGESTFCDACELSLSEDESESKFKSR